MIGPPDVAFVIQLGCFLVLYLVLKWGVFDPALRLITARRRAIDGPLAEAERLRREAAEMHAHYEATLEAARVSARKEIDDIRRRAEAEDERLLEQVRAETADMVAKVRETLAREVESARASMVRHAAEISLEAAEKVLGRSLR
jgi:F-type H+-transporting ATPase subunit b